jgi:hypothetical protein
VGEETSNEIEGGAGRREGGNEGGSKRSITAVTVSREARPLLKGFDLVFLSLTSLPVSLPSHPVPSPSLFSQLQAIKDKMKAMLAKEKATFGGYVRGVGGGDG